MAVNYSKYFKIEDYYEKYVIPINPRRFRVYNEKMVCPLHNDHDPSLGIMHKKNGELCHCFGCNFVGDIVKLHKYVVEAFQHRSISMDESLRELCSIFKVDYDKLPVSDFSSIEDRDKRQEFEMIQAMDSFDIGDFRYMIKQGKREKKGIAFFNTVMMVMLNEYKSQEED